MFGVFKTDLPLSQSSQGRLRQRAPVGGRGFVRAAAGADPLPPAGLPQPGSEVGGANEERSRTHRRNRHPKEGRSEILFPKSSHKLPVGAIEGKQPVFQVTRIFCYLTVVTLQYLVPVFLILFSTLALKALGK